MLLLWLVVIMQIKYMLAKGSREISLKNYGYGTGESTAAGEQACNYT